MLSIQAPLKKPILDFDIYQSVVYFAPHCGQSPIYVLSYISFIIIGVQSFFW